MSEREDTLQQVLQHDLTPSQRRAATDDAKEVLVIACAGSGKSRMLAYRIAWLIARGTKPESIVAFTFTNSAAESIQQRVATALAQVGHPATELGKIHIGTIHSFCVDLLGRVDARYRQFDVLDENGLNLFLISRYAELGLQAFSDRETKYFGRIKGIADAWTTLHNEVLDLQDVADLDQTLGSTLLHLEELLDAANYIDFSSMVRVIVDGLQKNHPSTLDAVGHIRHLLVDEYQDTNPLEERLIQLLKRGCDTLTVVGDDDQSIYGWRGADVSNILSFADRYPRSSEHTLAHNFRSTPLIVRSSDAFVAAELGANRLPKDPTADVVRGPYQVGAFRFTDRPSEAEWVAARIQALIGTAYEDSGEVRGLTPADFAILMRSTGANEQDDSSRSFAYTAALDERALPYTLEAGGSVFVRPQIALLRDALELLRDKSPIRPTVSRFIDTRIRPLFPNVTPDSLNDVYARWGVRIHTKVEVERRRVYPQQLLHELLAAFGIAEVEPDEGAMADIGVLSRLLQDVETVFVSIDTPRRFQGILNFMQNIAESGYQSATDAAVRRPDAVTVSTVHKAKGLEYPVVFIVDTEKGRFPGRSSTYKGWLPGELIAEAVDSPRRAYGNDRAQEARLFYTALTRAERFLYVTHASLLPGGKQTRRESPFSARLDDEDVVRESPLATELPSNPLPAAPQRRRVDEAVLPTTFSEMRYYLRCPRDYKYRHVWGFSPPIPELFGFGRTVHASVGKLHELFPNRAPTSEEAEVVAREIFHLKHVPPSNEPEKRPGAYERAQDASAAILRRYADGYSDDFEHRRQLEVRFEIPLRDSVLGGSIDLMLRVDDEERIIDASVIDFKTMEGGPDPESNEELDWTELALQVQLYARAAADVLDANVRTGAVHLLRDGQRVEVPVDEDAVKDAVLNVEWAAERIIEGDFPMRPHATKCAKCDWRRLCPMVSQNFATEHVPPALHLPGAGDRRMVRAFSETQQ